MNGSPEGDYRETTYFFFVCDPERSGYRALLPVHRGPVTPRILHAQFRFAGQGAPGFAPERIRLPNQGGTSTVQIPEMDTR